MTIRDEELTPPGGGRMAVAPPGALLPEVPAPPSAERTAESPAAPEDPEEFAEAAGVDPTPDEVAEYERRLDEVAPDPVSEPPD